MNSLEFIEKEIKELEFQINYIKSNMEKYIDFRTEGQLEVDMKQLKLKYLLQIKSELEAWEVCKEFIVNLGGEYEMSIDNYYNVNEYQTLKKALEEMKDA